ncbi:UPF0251 protein [Flexistipes sinusarabici DSM 4947]|uniref:UPF0251 protein Flexsi_1509 n=2 Tax=Flexistipes sinusarabici TaxID=2352 RepID=F8E8N6_FLESM|nr:DUF134 domain-containing protein [Flexistipes sinusarabici]AEI15159.1 UPF0251 protein [Flexistipes sinusarabici DSM 4947]HCW92530.1 DUF134 domain-containing protein [Flexistipes sinusarabici]
MPRQDKIRFVGYDPEVKNFKPSGLPSVKLDKVDLTIDEFEAIRLADYLGYDHENAALLMNISRPTFSRLIVRARHKVADFLVGAKELIIKGGNIEFVTRQQCDKCGLEVLDGNSNKFKHKCK